MSEVQETGTRRKIEPDSIKKPKASISKRNWYGILACAFAGFLMLGASLGIMISATTPGIPTVIEPGSMIKDSKFTVFADGTNYYALNGTTGSIQYSGTNPSTVIQNAISALTSGRTWQEKISLIGSFTFSPPAKTFAINTTSYLILEGANARLFLASSSSTSHYGIVGLWNVNNVTIERLTIDCNKAGQSDGSSDYRQNGIYGVVSSKDILIENCMVKNAKKIGIIFMAEVGHSANHKNVRIINNNLIGCRIASECMYDSQIMGNYIQNADSCGAIEIFGDHRNLTISGNHIVDAIHDGIQFYLDDGNTASYLTNNIISGNVIKNPGNHGIYIFGKRVRNDIISNNIIYNAHVFGIYVDKAQYITLAGNTINRYGVDSTYAVGIFLHFVNYTSIQGNHVSLCPNGGPYAISLIGSSHNTINGNVLTSTVLGIGLQTSSTYNILSGNVLGQGLEINGMDDGIYEFDATNDYNYVIGNQIVASTNVTIRGAHSQQAHNSYP